MHYLALRVKFLEDVTLEMLFQDGKVIRYDMSQMFEKYPQLEELRKNRKLFESGHLDLTGFAVIWNDELDFDATSIYEDGVVVGYEETALNQRIGFLLAKTRNEMNVTQKELSKKSHIDQGDISKIERGIGNPTVSKINKLFKALGKNISFTIVQRYNNSQR